MDMNQFTEEYGEIIGINVIDIKPSIAVSLEKDFYECCDKVVLIATREYVLYRPVIGMGYNDGDLAIHDIFDIKESITVDSLKGMIRADDDLTEERVEELFKSERKKLENFGVKVTE